MSEGLSDQEREKIDSRIKEAFSGYFEKAGGKNFRYYHLKNVHKLVLKIAEKLDENPDLRVLEASALLHDIGRKEDIEDGYMDPFEGHEGHDERGRKGVSQYIDDILEEERIQEVRKIVSNHHSEPESIECKVLQDADELTKYGVSDLWRMIHYAAEEERPIEEIFSYFIENLRPRLEEELGDFHFDISKRWAEERLENQSKAIDKMRKEQEARDFN
jgi:HD superfamily phosphodiesterase